MPFYIYKCRTCGCKLKARQKITDAPLTKCPGCHARKLKRIPQAAQVVFKGSGWCGTSKSGETVKESK